MGSLMTISFTNKKMRFKTSNITEKGGLTPKGKLLEDVALDVNDFMKWKLRLLCLFPHLHAEDSSAYL
jgi:hypothetical protein